MGARPPNSPRRSMRRSLFPCTTTCSPPTTSRPPFWLTSSTARIPARSVTGSNPASCICTSAGKRDHPQVRCDPLLCPVPLVSLTLSRQFSRQARQERKDLLGFGTRNPSLSLRSWRSWRENSGISGMERIRRLTLEAAQLHAFHDAAVGNEEDDEEGNGAQRGACHDGTVGFGSIGAAQEGEGHRKGKHLYLVDGDQRPEKIIPRRAEGEDRQGRHRRMGQRQDDP